MHQVAEDSFSAFAAARWSALFRCAYLLTGNTADAEDCVQVALVKAFARWGKIEGLEQPEAYVRRILVNTFLSSRRRRTRPLRERAADLESPSPEVAITSRLDIERALAQLPPRQRAVIILRFYCDNTEQQAADALGCAVGTVKSQTSDALRNLRRHLYDGDSSIEGMAP